MGLGIFIIPFIFVDSGGWFALHTAHSNITRFGDNLDGVKKSY